MDIGDFEDSQPETNAPATLKSETVISKVKPAEHELDTKFSASLIK